MKLAPDDARVRTNLGMTLAAAGKTKEAPPAPEPAPKGDAIGHANLGYLLAATGQFDEARQEYQTALAMRPDLALARRALVQLDRQEARDHRRRPQTQIARNPAADRPRHPRIRSGHGLTELPVPCSSHRQCPGSLNRTAPVPRHGIMESPAPPLPAIRHPSACRHCRCRIIACELPATLHALANSLSPVRAARTS